MVASGSRSAAEAVGVLGGPAQLLHGEASALVQELEDEAEQGEVQRRRSGSLARRRRGARRGRSGL